MLLFQFPVAEELLRRDDWALYAREWVGDPPRPRPVETATLTAGLNWYRANITHRELGPPALPPVQRRRSASGAAGTSPPPSPDDRLRQVRQGAVPLRAHRGAGHWMQLDAPDQVNELILHTCA